MKGSWVICLQKKFNPAPVLFLSHVGGPLPLLDDAQHTKMIVVHHAIAPILGKPAAILVISTHWKKHIVTITHGATPELIYDYYGFPAEAYSISFPAPGAPELANEICSLLQQHGIASQLDAQRGFDHGLFVPLKIMFPAADIPCVQ